VKPFLSAFLQSSVPDDIIADLRYCAFCRPLLENVCLLQVCFATSVVFQGTVLWRFRGHLVDSTVLTCT